MIALKLIKVFHLSKFNAMKAILRISRFATY
jgi:hypothetical protein